jgi:hypothetical protein
MPLGGGLTLASAGIGVASGIAQTAMGFIDEKKSKNELARLQKPFQKIQDEYLKNRDLAEIGAGQGLPSATKDFLTKESERGLSTGIRGILESGGSPNDIAKLFDTFDTSVSKTAAEDAEARLGNIKYFMDVNKDLAGQKNIQFGVNELQPYESALKSITDRRTAARQNIFGGISTAAGSLSAAGTAISNTGLLKSHTDNPKADLFNSIFTELPDNIRPVTTPDANPIDRTLANGPKPLNLSGKPEATNWWDNMTSDEISSFLTGFIKN